MAGNCELRENGGRMNLLSTRQTRKVGRPEGCSIHPANRGQNCRPCHTRRQKDYQRRERYAHIVSRFSLDDLIVARECVLHARDYQSEVLDYQSALLPSRDPAPSSQTGQSRIDRLLDKADLLAQQYPDPVDMPGDAILEVKRLLREADRLSMLWRSTLPIIPWKECRLGEPRWSTNDNTVAFFSPYSIHCETLYVVEQHIAHEPVDHDVLRFRDLWLGTEQDLGAFELAVDVRLHAEWDWDAA